MERWRVLACTALEAEDANGQRGAVPAGRRCWLPRGEAIRAAQAGLVTMLSPDGIKALAEALPVVEPAAVTERKRSYRRRDVTADD